MDVSVKIGDLEPPAPEGSCRVKVEHMEQDTPLQAVVSVGGPSGVEGGLSLFPSSAFSTL